MSSVQINPPVCRHCGAALEGGNAFCTGCGAPHIEAPAPAARQEFCTACGAAITAQTSFCTSCGAPRQMPSIPVAQIPAPAAVQSRASGKVPVALFAVLAVVFLVVVLSIAAIAYVVHRARQKAAELESRANFSRAMSDLKAAAERASGSDAGSARSGESNDNAGKVSAPYGWTTDASGKLVPVATPFEPVPATPAAAPIVPAVATGDTAHDWAMPYERTENGPEADLVVRTGDINNLGFGWPQGFDPFSGQSTPPHSFPWDPRPGAPDGTDRILLGSAIDPADSLRHPESYRDDDGYSHILRPCEGFLPPEGKICKARQESMPQPIRLEMGALPAKIHSVLVQIFVDDFQAVDFGSHFQVSLNGTRIPSFEYAINSLDQTGPIGKLVSLSLLPEYWPLLESGEAKLLIDDPVTKQGDGYAVDFVRVLVNPHKFKYEVSLNASVIDADQHTPIAGAVVTAGLDSATADSQGKARFQALPAGLVIAAASAPGYDANAVPVDLPAGQAGNAVIALHRHQEDVQALEKSIAQTGSATIYGIHFDTDSAKLRPDSEAALNAVLALMNQHATARWLVSGHTDSQGNAAHNEPLSQRRAAAVTTWLTQHGVAQDRLVAQGFGATRPVADNATAAGRALNRRVEVAMNP